MSEMDDWERYDGWQQLPPIEQDADQAYEDMRQRELDDRVALHHRLGAMVRHISAHNSFDKQRLVALLKEAQQAVTPNHGTVKVQAE